MADEDFIHAVAKRAGVSMEQATSLTQATLMTLADRISAGEAADLAGSLPDSLAQHVRKSPVRELAEPFGLAEFVRRVSERAGADEIVATAGAQAVLTSLQEAVARDEFDDVIAQLPREIGELVEPIDAGHLRGRRK